MAIQIENKRTTKHPSVLIIGSRSSDRSLGLRLKQSGASVCIRQDISNTSDVMRRQSPDCIVLLGVGDIEATSAWIRSIQLVDRWTPIIVVDRNVHGLDRAKIIARGATQVISKMNKQTFANQIINLAYFSRNYSDLKRPATIDETMLLPDRTTMLDLINQDLHDPVRPTRVSVAVFCSSTLNYWLQKGCSQAGNVAKLFVATGLQQFSGTRGNLAHISGSMFLLRLANNDFRGAQETAQSCADKIGQYKFTYGGYQPCNFKVTWGVADSGSDHVQWADELLYIALQRLRSSEKQTPPNTKRSAAVAANVQQRLAA